MTPITLPQLQAACGCSAMRAANWLDGINGAALLWGIDTPKRQASWLAQISHESGRLVYVKELWGPTPAQRRYEGRLDLGNTQPGDGFRYRGRGLIQITGRDNYAGVTRGLRAVMPDAPDFVARPEMLEVPKWAAHSAGWYWSSRNLNALADAGDFERITRKINGGLNGYDDRLALWAGATAALGVA